MTSATTTLPAAWRNAEDEVVRDAVEAHYEVLWRFLRRMGVDEHHVEDAAQQVLIVFSRRTADVPREAVRSFLLGTALRVASEWRRKDARAGDSVAIDSLGDHAHPDPDAEHVVAQREMRRMLDRVLDALSPELRAVFVLAELEEMTMAAIARVLSIPPGTVAKLAVAVLRLAGAAAKLAVAVLRLAGAAAKLAVAVLRLAGAAAKLAVAVLGFADAAASLAVTALRLRAACANDAHVRALTPYPTHFENRPKRRTGNAVSQR